MGLSSTREQHLVQQARDYGTNFVRNAHLRESSRRIAEIIAPKAAIMNANSIDSVDRKYLFVYKKKTFGRVCSCITDEASSPTGTCPICHATGFVGGYDKYGTWLEDIDYTREVDLINIEPAFELNYQPTLLRLEDGATKGEILATIPIRTNAGYTDAVDYVDSISDRENSSITLYARETNTLKWYPFTIDNSKNLDPMLGASSLDIKIVLQRRDANVQTPYFCDLKWRYGLLPKQLLSIPVDTPRNSEGVSLLDYGWDESYGILNVNMDARIQSLSNGDLFYYQNRSRWLAVTEVNPFQSVDTFIGIEASARFVQTYEPVTKVMV